MAGRRSAGVFLVPRVGSDGLLPYRCLPTLTMCRQQTQHRHSNQPPNPNPHECLLAAQQRPERGAAHPAMPGLSQQCFHVDTKSTTPWIGVLVKF